MVLPSSSDIRRRKNFMADYTSNVKDRKWHPSSTLLILM